MSKLRFVLMLLLSGSTALAQKPFTTSEYLDINKIRAAHLVHGDMWRNLAKVSADMEFPQGSGKHTGFIGATWMSGRDESGAIHAAAAGFRTMGIDLWPGPLDVADTLGYTTSQEWARIWKINRTDIGTFLSLGVRSVSTVPAVILEWPAKGNVYAKGTTGASLDISEDMAPFVDVNSDGHYNALDGDYPDMKGDQMLWWVFSDNGPAHTGTQGLPLKLECHASAYAYNRGTDADRMLFYEFLLYNKSDDKYTDFRFGFFFDGDLGHPFDDYIAFDSSHRMGIEYNATLPDGTGSGNSYGAHPPVTGLSLIELPGDDYPATVLPAGSFNYYGSVGGMPGYEDPVVDTHFYHLMRSRSTKGAARPFGNYAYPITEGAVACDEHLALADRRFVVSSGDHEFKPGAVLKVGLAFITTDTTGNACPGIDFKPLTDLADTAWKIYYHPLPGLSNKELALATLGLNIWPNPASEQLLVQTKVLAEELQVTVYDQLGRALPVPVQRNGTLLSLDLGTLAPGMYALSCKSGSTQHTELFLRK